MTCFWWQLTHNITVHITRLSLKESCLKVNVKNVPTFAGCHLATHPKSRSCGSRRIRLLIRLLFVLKTSAATSSSTTVSTNCTWEKKQIVLAPNGGNFPLRISALLLRQVPANMSETLPPVSYHEDFNSKNLKARAGTQNEKSGKQSSCCILQWHTEPSASGHTKKALLDFAKEHPHGQQASMPGINEQLPPFRLRTRAQCLRAHAQRCTRRRKVPTGTASGNSFTMAAKEGTNRQNAENIGRRTTSSGSDSRSQRARGHGTTRDQKMPKGKSTNSTIKCRSNRPCVCRRT